MSAIPRLFLDKLSWVLLLRISQSFVSKIITGISLSVFVLSHTQRFTFFENADFSFKVIMLGGLAFLVGYIIVAIYAPSEFRETLSVNDAIIRQKNIEYYNSFTSRIDMLENMIARVESDFPIDMTNDPVNFAKISVKNARKTTIENWKDTSAALYLADLNLRQYDNFFARIFASTLLAIGLLSTVYSTAIGSFQVIAGWR